MKTETKKKHGINFIDIVLIIVVVAIIVAGVYFLSHLTGAKDTGDNVTLTYKIEVSNVDEEISTAPAVGDVVVDQVSKSELGKIIAVEREPMTIELTDYIGGEMKKAEVPGKFKVILTCESPAASTGEKVTINSHRMGVGTGVSFRSKNFSGNGVCVATQITDQTKGGLIND